MPTTEKCVEFLFYAECTFSGLCVSSIQAESEERKEGRTSFGGGGGFSSRKKGALTSFFLFFYAKGLFEKRERERGFLTACNAVYVVKGLFSLFIARRAVIVWKGIRASLIYLSPCHRQANIILLSMVRWKDSNSPFVSFSFLFSRRHS